MGECGIVLVQLNPVYRDVKGNRQAAEALVDRLLSNRGVGRVDVIVLPEMAFSGYNFSSPDDIRDICQHCEHETKDFCIFMAKKYSSGVVCGYCREDPSSKLLYNSQMVVNPSGEVISVYDKSHLFYSDETWCSEGSGFISLILPWILKADGTPIKVAQGICMDINPKKFEAPWTDYELASFCVKEDVDLLLFSSAWTSEEENDRNRNDYSTVNYWFQRLYPMMEEGKERFFICANRVGKEENERLGTGKEGFTHFVGNSCVIDLRQRALLEKMEPDEVGARFVKIEFGAQMKARE